MGGLVGRDLEPPLEHAASRGLDVGRRRRAADPARARTLEGEVAAGAIRHALRFTAERTRRAYVYPARHYASS